MSRVYSIAILMLLFALVIAVRIITIINNDEVSMAASTNGRYTIKAIDKYTIVI